MHAYISCVIYYLCLVFITYIHTLYYTLYTGITGFAIAFIFPALLAMSAERACIKRGMDTTTPYSLRILTSRYMQYFVISVGVFLCLFVLINLLLEV